MLESLPSRNPENSSAPARLAKVATDQIQIGPNVAGIATLAGQELISGDLGGAAFHRRPLAPWIRDATEHAGLSNRKIASRGGPSPTTVGKRQRTTR